MRKNGSYSRTARKRRERAADLSKRMRQRDATATFSLLQRRRALAGIAKHGWTARLARANGTCRFRRREQELCEREARRLAALHEREQRARDAASELMRKRAKEEMEQRFNRATLRVSGERHDYKYRDGARDATWPACG